MSNTIKENHKQFQEEFFAQIKEHQADLAILDISLPTDLSQIDEFVDKVYRTAFKKKDNIFLTGFITKYYSILSDLLSKNAKLKDDLFPLTITYSYHGEIISEANMPNFIHENVMFYLNDSAYKFANSHLIPMAVLQKYVEGDETSRGYVMQYLDYQRYRNWKIIKMHLQYIRDSYPECFDKISKDSEFLSLAEIEEKVKEQEQNNA